MSDPQQYTVEQASDPATPAQTLADIAALRADLRPAVAANPTAYPGLLDWLGGIGDPQVDAALAARAAAQESLQTGAPEPMPAADEQPQPTEQQGWPAQQPQPMEQQGWPAQPQPEPWQTQRPQPMGQQGWPAQYPAPGQPDPAQWQGHAQPQQWQGQAQPPQWQAQPAYLGAPPPKRNGGKIAAIIIGVLVVVGALAFGAFLLLSNLIRGVSDQIEEGVSDVTSFSLPADEAPTPGTEPELDALWASCAEGDMIACDDLFWASEPGSDYETFGSTCGGRTDGEQWSCADSFGDG